MKTAGDAAHRRRPRPRAERHGDLSRARTSGHPGDRDRHRPRSAECPDTVCDKVPLPGFPERRPRPRREPRADRPRAARKGRPLPFRRSQPRRHLGASRAARALLPHLAAAEARRGDVPQQEDVLPVRHGQGLPAAADALSDEPRAHARARRARFSIPASSSRSSPTTPGGRPSTRACSSRTRRTISSRSSSGCSVSTRTSSSRSTCRAPTASCGGA